MTMTPVFPRLLADVGGTNARLAFQAEPGAPLQHIASYECTGFASLGEAIRHHLARHACARPQALALGVATPVAGDAVRFTNNPWSFSIQALKAELGLERLLVLNDFAALAMGLPLLGPGDCLPLGGGRAEPGAPMVVMGPGTGLGVAALVRQQDGRTAVISGEGGHATLAAANDFEADVLRVLRSQFGHVSAERVLSGPGLVNLHAAIGELQGLAGRALLPAEVLAGAQSGSDAQCIAAVDLFLDFLAGFAGNLVLSFGALGGLYVGGGIVPRFGGLLDPRRFRRRLEDKGRFRAYVERVPSCVITAPHVALLGAGHALDQAAG